MEQAQRQRNRPEHAIGSGWGQEVRGRGRIPRWSVPWALSGCVTVANDCVCNRMGRVVLVSIV